MYGLLDRQTAESLLQGKGEGTFVIRTSCSSPKHVVISVVDNGVVEHDIVDSRYFEQRRNIDDVLLFDCPRLTHVLTSTGAVVPKEEAFDFPTKNKNRYDTGQYRRAGKK